MAPTTVTSRGTTEVYRRGYLKVLYFSVSCHSVLSNAYEEYQYPHTQMEDHSPDHE